jgi:hypothetical protein
MFNSRCYISPSLEEKLGNDFYRVKNDINGNPRYVTHFHAFLNDNEFGTGDYELAKKRANSLGFKVYRGKDFGGGFVCQSYNLENDIERILELRGFEIDLVC